MPLESYILNIYIYKKDCKVFKEEEKMQFYTFKFNLEPNILQTYNYASHKENVVSVVIPNALKEIFKSFEKMDENKIKFKDYIDIGYVKKSDEYREMLKLNITMIEMYQNVLKNFNDGKGINYSPEYLTKRTELRRSIEHLIEKYPFLKEAFEVKDSIFPVDAFASVKMSVAYIRKGKKIEYFVNNFPKSISESEFIYDTENEYIYISTENRNNKEAISYVNNLEGKINNLSVETNIGRISINPIYEQLLLEGLYSEITIKLVYPNGDSARDRSRAIERVNAAKESRTFEASKEDKIDASLLNEYLKEDAEKGYVHKVTSKGKDIVKSLIKIVRF